MRLADHSSRASVCAAHERMDPYWSGMWNLGATANWFSRQGVQRLVDQELMAAPSWLELSVEQAAERVAYGTRSNASLSAIAALGCWRTLSSEQLAAIIGAPQPTMDRSPFVPTLLATGLVAEGVVKTPWTTDIPKMLRPVATAKTDPLFGILPYRDLVGVTHGQPWRSGTYHDRHNMLVAELLLRVAEYTNVSLVLGEQLARLSQLTDSPSQRAGDGVLVRSDGAVVVLEVTATVSANFPAKVDRWVDALSTNNNLSVLFVDVTHPDYTDAGNRISNAIRKEVSRATSTMGARLAGVHQRMMVARWADWFPDAHEVDPSFFSMTAVRPTGRPPNQWQQVSIMDPFDFTLPPAGTALLENSNLLYGIPHWQRTGTATLDPLPTTTDSGHH